ncbi:MAG: DJ-1/PfpI family protein [Eubacteriaceae bacterium]|nr:DJ-1/PfpI family protein [Eubacteriaceae bacterium]
MIDLNIVLFDGFETLDALGPAEIFGKLQDEYTLNYISINGGSIISSQQLSVNTVAFAEIDDTGILLIPGGIGTRKLVNDSEFISELKRLANKAPYVLTVCTGSALLARTDLLSGKRATTNKVAFEWASSNGLDVKWAKKARWVVDGKYYTSSGVSAGMDMALGFISDINGNETAVAVARGIEYIWNTDARNDPFALE